MRLAKVLLGSTVWFALGSGMALAAQVTWNNDGTVSLQMGPE